MKKVVFLMFVFICFFVCISALSQEKKDDYGKMVIGISNKKQDFYDVIKYIDGSGKVKVCAICDIHQVIEIKILQKELSDFEELEYFLQLRFEEIVVYKKDGNILTKDCKDEYEKYINK